MTNYYKILGVPRTATRTDIDKAYHKLRAKFGSEDLDDPYFRNLYRKIIEAYNVLSSENQRIQYDNKIGDQEIQVPIKQQPKQESLEPVIDFFKTNKNIIEIGEKIILSWKTSNADEVTLTPKGKVSFIGSKIIHYNEFTQDKICFSLRAVNYSSGKETTQEILLEKAKLVSEPSNNNPTLPPNSKIKLRSESHPLLKRPLPNSDNNNKSTIKRYGIPGGVVVLLIAIVLFVLGQSGFWESNSPSQKIVENAPIKEIEESSSLIALNWEEIEQEKEHLIQNLRRSSKPEDERILEFIQGMQEILRVMNNSLYRDENYDKLSSMLYGSSKINPEAAKFLENVEQYGFKISHSEGMPFLEENTTFIKTVVEPNIRNPLALQYLYLHLEGIDTPCCEDAGLMISYDELIKRTYNWGEFLFKAHNSSLENIAVNKFASYINLTFEGLANTPAFEYDTGRYNRELLSKLEQHILDYPFSLSAIEFKEYIKLLKSENFERTYKVQNYVNTIDKANFNLFSEEFYPRFRDPDFYFISPEEKIRRLIVSENQRDFANSGSFYSNLIKRYFNQYNQTYTELNMPYGEQSSKSYSESIVRNVIMVRDMNFELIADFKFIDQEGNSTTHRRAVHYTFNNEGLIEEVFEVDSDFTYQDFRDNDFNYTSEEDKIRGLLKAEDNRNYFKIASFYSADMKRYWHTTNPTFIQINDLYQSSWKVSSYSKNQILNIEALGNGTYDVNLRFTFHNNKTNQLEEKESYTRYIFNERGLIVEIYGLENRRS